MEVIISCVRNDCIYIGKSVLIYWFVWLFLFKYYVDHLFPLSCVENDYCWC
jgi:hypothetical protein